jgi:hypothetical protein
VLNASLHRFASAQVYNAQQAGADMVIVYDADPTSTSIFVMSPGGPPVGTVTAPSVSTDGQTGALLASELQGGKNVAIWRAPFSGASLASFSSMGPTVSQQLEPAPLPPCELERLACLY